jgi:hypothetical protein
LSLFFRQRSEPDRFDLQLVQFFFKAAADLKQELIAGEEALPPTGLHLFYVSDPPQLIAVAFQLRVNDAQDRWRLDRHIPSH